MRATCRFAILFTMLGAAGVAARSPQAPADQPAATFRSSTDLVTIQASVRDKRGRPMGELSTADFEVRDNGQLRPIITLRSDMRSPVSVAIVVDMSGSMRLGSKMTMARQAVDSIVSQLRDGEDEVALFTFDSALHEQRAFTSDLQAFAGALLDVQPFGTTSLFDAAAESAQSLAARSATHKAVIVITDGIDTSSTLNTTQVSGLASSINVPVYVIATVPNGDQRAMMEDARRPRESGAADLRDLAEWTGGQLLFASTTTDATIVSSRMIDELRHQYVLAIEAASGREWRRLEVRVKHPAASVKARSGYYGG